jgi:hypothetical protein
MDRCHRPCRFGPESRDLRWHVRQQLYRRTGSFCVRRPLPVHSAHIGQDVEVHYRWHPLYGRRVKVRDIEQRGGDRVVHVEASAGVVRIVAGWMLDSVMCAGMEPGNPRVTVAALRELHQLLVERGLRGNSPDDSNTVREKRNGYKGRSIKSVARDSSPDEPGVRHRRASGDERSPAYKGDELSCQTVVAGRRRRSKGA